MRGIQDAPSPANVPVLFATMKAEINAGRKKSVCHPFQALEPIDGKRVCVTLSWSLLISPSYHENGIGTAILGGAPGDGDFASVETPAYSSSSEP
jgi:hypothetical protein